jgi:hypothetical protein
MKIVLAMLSVCLLMPVPAPLPVTGKRAGWTSAIKLGVEVAVGRTVGTVVGVDARV